MARADLSCLRREAVGEVLLIDILISVKLSETPLSAIALEPEDSRRRHLHYIGLSARGGLALPYCEMPPGFTISAQGHKPNHERLREWIKV